MGRNYSSKNTAGFTLVELLITIVIIGILVSGLILIIDPATQLQKNRDAQRKSDLAQIQKAFETFHQDNGKYPNAEAESNKIKGLDGNVVDWGATWLPYMSILPKDPSSPSKNYVYYSHPDSNGQTYYIYASLDRGGNDPHACTGSNNACSGPPIGSNINMQNACGGVCNYGVSSPNVSP